MKRLVSLFVVALLLAPTLLPKAARADGAAVVGTDNLQAVVNQALAITDVQITGVSGSTPVKLLVSHGTLAMSLTAGLTFDGSSSGAEIYFSGAIADVNAALATLTYTRSSTGTDTLEVSLVTRGEVFFSDNGHLYEYISVPGGINWVDANVAATGLTRYGATGYLVTITSDSENTFAAARLLGEGWMGASDAAAEGTWKWVAGPENNTNFWNGGSGGSPALGAYANWNTDEPNNLGDEDCAQFLSGGSSGKWNDLPCSASLLAGYVAEFGAPSGLPATTGNEFTITTYTATTISSLSPTDGATNVSGTTNLVITFSQAVNVGTGNITIVRTNGATTVATIDVTSGQVTGNGTNTITINPSGTLPGSTDLYVNIAPTAFTAVAGGAFAGISNSTTWNFTTQHSGTTSGTTVTGAGLTIVSAVTSCSGSITGTLLLTGTNAEQYQLSNESRFLTSTWETFAGSSMALPWIFTNESGTATVYALLKNSSGSLVSLDATITPTNGCTVVVDDTDATDTSTEADNAADDNVRTGRSPWNGTIQIITNIEGAQLMKGENYDTVYYLENGVRRPFMGEAIYFTWFTDFSGIRIVTDATLATVPMGQPMLPRAGSLVKIQSKNAVYLVTDTTNGPTLTYIPSETEAAQRFGNDWASLVRDVDVTLFDKFIQ